MKTAWFEEAWVDYEYWLSQDKKTMKELFSEHNNEAFRGKITVPHECKVYIALYPVKVYSIFGINAGEGGQYEYFVPGKYL